MKPASNRRSRARPLLGTFVEIAAHGLPMPALDRAIEAAFAAVALTHRLMSFHEPDSDLARLNRAGPGETVAVHPWTYAVIETALDLHRGSSGLFDIAVAPALQRLGLLPGAALEEAAGSTAIELLPEHRIRLHEPAARLDLGGIAKGFAVDRAIEALRRAGVSAGLVNAGGDLAGFGPVPHLVLLRDPRVPQRVFGRILLRDAALASSGRRLDAPDVPLAVIDPRSGGSATRFCGATVLAPSCMIADALTKLVLLVGADCAALLVEFGAEALAVAADGTALASPGWPALEQAA